MATAPIMTTKDTHFKGGATTNKQMGGAAPATSRTTRSTNKSLRQEDPKPTKKESGDGSILTRVHKAISKKTAPTRGEEKPKRPKVLEAEARIMAKKVKEGKRKVARKENEERKMGMDAKELKRRRGERRAARGT